MVKIVPLVIGDLIAKVPLIQGGMGARVRKKQNEGRDGNKNHRNRKLSA